jgi:hypothetical protein
MKTKHLTATSIAKDDLPEEVVKAAEGKDIDRWYYATVETPDREKDIVRVKGLDTAKYTQSGGPMRVLVSHQRAPNANSRLPICGGVKEWVPTKHKATGLPALAAGIKFVDTELGKEIKTLADADLLDVSIGFEPLEADPIPGGGFDYKKAAISELSVCVNGMNQYAGVVRALEAESKSVGTVHVDVVPNIAGHVLTKLDDESLDAILSELKSLHLRLDDLEDAIAGSSQAAEQSAGHTPPPSEKSESDITVADLLSALNAIKPRK